RWRAGRDRRATAPDAKSTCAPYSWAQPGFAGVVDHALDLDHVFLVVRIKQQIGAPAWARQMNIEDLIDAAGRARHHHELVVQKSSKPLIPTIPISWRLCATASSDSPPCWRGPYITLPSTVFQGNSANS